MPGSDTGAGTAGLDLPIIYEQDGPIAELYLNEKPLVLATDLEAKDKFLECLEQTAADSRIKVLIIHNYAPKLAFEEYVRFYKRLLDPDEDKTYLVRMLYALDRVILKIVAMPQIVIYVDFGRIIMQFMALGLACDYRIVSDDTWFQKGYHMAGLIPKGGSTYFLPQLLGRAKAHELFFSRADIPAADALGMGLVNRIVPSDALKEEARRTAEEYAEYPAYFLLSMKLLLNRNISQLKDHLEQENSEILRARGLSAFREVLRGIQV